MAESLVAEISEIMREQGIDQIADHCMNLFRLTDQDNSGVVRLRLLFAHYYCLYYYYLLLTNDKPYALLLLLSSSSHIYPLLTSSD